MDSDDGGVTPLGWKKIFRDGNLTCKKWKMDSNDNVTIPKGWKIFRRDGNIIVLKMMKMMKRED